MLLLCAMIIACSEEEFTSNVTDQSEAKLLKAKGQAIPGQYIVVYKNSDAASQIRSQNAASSRKLMNAKAMSALSKAGANRDNLGHVYGKSLVGFSASLSARQLNQLRQDPEIAYIEEDQMMSVDMGGPPGGGGGGSDPQQTPWGITRVNGGVDGSGTVAYIIDSGIDASHPDLNVDVSRGYNAFTRGKDSDLAEDGNGHGTHVAGTVGAIDNSEGVIGVAAGATVVPVKVLGSRGSGSNSGVIAGVNHVAGQSDCDAANMSLGGGFTQALNDAVIAASANCPFALAAGNESTDANNSSPASANGPNIYTISSMAQGDNWSSFSNYGNPPVDYCAPGSSVLSTYKGGSYRTLSGTSMASPHVCGILLLGNIATDGTVSGDPDGNADPIAVN